jgi:hypothetical protein
LAFSLCAWIVLGSAPAYVGLSADVRGAAPARGAGLTNATFDSRFAAAETRNSFTTASVSTSFDDRFAFNPSATRTRSLQPSSTFSARFDGALAPGVAPTRFMLASVTTSIQPPPAVAQAPAPHAAARALIARVTPKRNERPAAAPVRVASLGNTPIRTAYASGDSATRDAAIDDSLLRKMTPRDPAPKDAATKDPATTPDMSHTAIYDITRHMVYLPNGRRLEAHSGLGEHLDDLGAVTQRSVGPTPPGLYELTMREAVFHGVDAIRLNPVDNGKMYGRAGILAHPYMMGPNGQSNGCVSFKDYNAFLAAFRRGDFNQLLVVERLDNVPGEETATGWIADKLRGLFGRS